MKRLPPLNEQQQQLVEKNLTVIHWAIHNFVKINETVFGFEYDDLYGEGCVLLCKAAATYDTLDRVFLCPDRCEEWAAFLLPHHVQQAEPAASASGSQGL